MKSEQRAFEDELDAALLKAGVPAQGFYKIWDEELLFLVDRATGGQIYFGTICPRDLTAIRYGTALVATSSATPAGIAAQVAAHIRRPAQHGDARNNVANVGGT